MTQKRNALVSIPLLLCAAFFAFFVFSALPAGAQTPRPVGLVQVASDTGGESLQAKRIVAGKPQWVRLQTASRFFVGDVLIVPAGSRPIMAFYKNGTRFRLQASSVVRVLQNRLQTVSGTAPAPLRAYSPQALSAFRFETPSNRFGMTTGGDLNRNVFHLLPIGAILLPASEIAVTWASGRSTDPAPTKVTLLRRTPGEGAQTVWTGDIPAETAPPYRFNAPELVAGSVYECVCETGAGLQSETPLRVLSAQNAKNVAANVAFLRGYIASAEDDEERGGTYCLLALLYEKHELYADADAAYEKARVLLPADQLLKKAPRSVATP